MLAQPSGSASFPDMTFRIPHYLTAHLILLFGQENLRVLRVHGRDEGGPFQAAAWAAAIFLNSYFSRICDFSGVIGPAFSAYVFGVFFRGIFWGGFGGRFGVRRIFSDVFS